MKELVGISLLVACEMTHSTALPGYMQHSRTDNWLAFLNQRLFFVDAGDLVKQVHHVPARSGRKVLKNGYYVPSCRPAIIFQHQGIHLARKTNIICGIFRFLAHVAIQFARLMMVPYVAQEVLLERGAVYQALKDRVHEASLAQIIHADREGYLPAFLWI